MSHFIKIDSTGAEQSADFVGHVAVRDTRTGLIWSVAQHKVKNWKAANKHAESLDLLGWSWRFPRYHKYTIGADLRREATAVFRGAHRA